MPLSASTLNDAGCPSATLMLDGCNVKDGGPTGVTALEGADAGLVPIAFVAFTVKV